MARKLEVFTTSAGFVDLAVSTPSMEAAHAARGAEHILPRASQITEIFEMSVAP